MMTEILKHLLLGITELKFPNNQQRRRRMRKEFIPSDPNMSGQGTGSNG